MVKVYRKLYGPQHRDTLNENDPLSGLKVLLKVYLPTRQ